MPPPPAAAPHSHAAERRALLARAVDAFRKGYAPAGAAPLAGATEGQLSEELREYMYARLVRSDHASLAEAGRIREHALALGRAGRQEEAEATMKLARSFLWVAGLSSLGRVASDTFQQAAESYLSYRRGDYADASARITAAVDATDRLAAAWGESFFTTGRRVHLLHNQVKLEARRGAMRDAVRLGAGILAYLAGSTAVPAVPALAPSASALDPVIAHRYSNFVGGTIAEVLAVVPDAEAKELLALLGGVEPVGPAAAARAWAWLPLKSAALAADPRAFLEAAAPFLRAGTRRAPVFFYAVALDVVRAARRLGAGAADDVAEIECVLGTDARVPRPLQVAAREGQAPVTSIS